MLMTVKNMSQFGQNIYVHLKDLTEFFQEIIWLTGFWVTDREISKVETSKKLLSQQKNTEILCFQGFASG